MSRADFDLSRSWLVQFLLDEQSEILRHKWLESEKVGHDIGWAWARCDWKVRHSSKYLHQWVNNHRPDGL